jgi:hypothetical protein
MVGYNRPGSALESYLITVSTSSQLNSFLSKLIKEYSGISVKLYNQSYGSDHISWHNAGYASSGWKEFYWSPQYHQPSDKPGVISFELIKEFSKVGVAFLIELSNA